MESTDYIISQIPIELIQEDTNQPRKEFGTDGTENRLALSLKEIGIQQALVVRHDPKHNTYILLDGHRRYKCARQLFKEGHQQFATLPCKVYPSSLSETEFERIRFEIQNLRRPWHPLERADAINRIKNVTNWNSEKIADYLHMSRTIIGNSLELRDVQIPYLELMQKKELSEAFQIEMMRLKKELWKVGEFQPDDIFRDIIERKSNKTIRTAKEIRDIKKLFVAGIEYRDALETFFKDPVMRVSQLLRLAGRADLGIALKEMIKSLRKKREDGNPLSPQEEALKQELLNELTK